jgi:hypothetical protein
MKKPILCLLISFVMVGCTTHKEDSTTQETSEQDSAAHQHEAHIHGGTDPRVKEVMAIHDSIMPAMGTIMELKQKIALDIKATDSLLAIKSGTSLKQRKTQGIFIQKQLEKADEEMMGWMHQYHADTLSKLDEKGTMIYLSDQKQKIEAVRELMNRSIADAQSFILKTK